MPAIGQPGEIGRREDAAFADDHTIGRDQLRQPLGGRKRRLERAQIPVVDADQPRFEPQRPRQLGLVMHLDEHVHAERKGCRFELGRGGVLERRHDDQDAIGASRARLGHLIRVVHEVLAQRRQRASRARRAQVIERALEGGRVGQDGEAGRSALRISRRQGRRIEIFADQTF